MQEQNVPADALKDKTMEMHHTMPEASMIRPLGELKVGQTAIIDALQGGYGFRSRLAALGFTPGTAVHMVQNRGHGPVIITIRDTRIALGRGEAQRVLVKLGREADDDTVG